MATPTDAKRELDLIEKVEWRILSTSSDEEKLQELLKIYLAPLLLKAGSEHVAVRNKVRKSHLVSSDAHTVLIDSLLQVISTCQTINKLIKAPGCVIQLVLEESRRHND